MANLIIFAICMLSCFTLGYLTHLATEVAQQETDGVKRHRKPRLKITRYWLGNKEFNVSLFRVKNFCNELENTSDGCKVMGQIYHIGDLTKCIVGLIIGYDLKWFENDKFNSTVQAEIDLFVKNLERFDRFLQQPQFVIQSGIDEAIMELKDANQPILNHMGAIKNSVTNYIETGDYKLIEFNQ